MTNNTFSKLTTYSDRISADAILEVLTKEGLPAYIESDAFVPGLGSNFSIFVPADQVSRAQALLQQANVSEAELTELALRSPQDGRNGES